MPDLPFCNPVRALVGALTLLALLVAGVLLTQATGPAAADGEPHALALTLHPQDATYRPGEAVALTGRAADASLDAVKLQVALPDGSLRGPYGPFPVSAGDVRATLPAAATAGIRRGGVAVTALPAGATSTSRAAASDRAAAAVAVATPGPPVLENSFVSSVGWVKPGETYPFTLRVRNTQAAPVDGQTVTVPPVDGTTFTRIVTGDGGSIGPDGTLRWTVGPVPGTTDPTKPGTRSLVVEARADTLEQDPQIVWKNLSTSASGPAFGSPATSHGPKVIPPSETYDTARYGDRPFPVVPVDYFDRGHGEPGSAGKLATKINDPANPGSTFNLYQEMSYGQLFPNGTVPSAGIAARGWDYGPGFAFTRTVPGNTCQSPTTADLPGDVYAQGRDRIKDGWYQLPGPTAYYGSDANGSALIGAEAGVGALQNIDSGCGPAAKAVYDAAQIADPEIDYNDYDTDKDGVVDFFMMIFAGQGGNGDSQINGRPPYDNIWPHSATLETAYTDPKTGLKGYVSDDRLKNLEGQPLWYTDASRTRTTTDDKGPDLAAYVRVGPYNVNPESAIDKASVISHEYGHSLGLPDLYSTGSRNTYGTWNLMAEDRSQHMDVFSRQELGWLVPRVLEPGRRTEIRNEAESTRNTHRIDWQGADGKPYTLQGDGVDNGEAYVAKLPARQIIRPDAVPSGTHLFWSQAGNDFGCPPVKGRNLDIALPQLKDVPAGTPVKLTFKTSWDIEWDFDYGFVLTTTDGGQSYQSHPSDNGYTTPRDQNPNSSDCQAQYGNGLTGSSASYDQGQPAIDRVLGNYGDLPHFVDDSYDLSGQAGKPTTLRFTYATDPGLARTGWFIDDIKVTAGDRVIYQSDAEAANDPSVFNGGCREGLQTATKCTRGWQQVNAVDRSPADHAYYFEMRDRTGFDLDGKGEDSRGDGPTWQPGLSLVYTDEQHGYGNVGTDDPPAQSPLDSKPVAGDDAPDLDDAAFQATAGRNAFSDAPPGGHLDNYTDPASADGNWRLSAGCLSFTVTRMTGDANGPGAAPGDLTGDVDVGMAGLTTDFKTGCGAFDYGYGKGVNTVSVPGFQPANVASSSCTAKASAVRSVSASGRGRSLVVRAVPRARRGKVTIDLLRETRGAKVVRQRRVTRRVARGRATLRFARSVASGVYVVRVRSGHDLRRVAVQRRHGRWTRRAAFERRSVCGLLTRAVLARPVVGGRVARQLTLTYQVRRSATVSVAVVRGKRVLSKSDRLARTAGRFYKLRVPASKLRRGAVRVVVTAKSGKDAGQAVLAARRL